MAIYRVEVPDKDGKVMHTRLVDAPNQASARGHVARSLFKIEVVKTVDAFRLAQAGVELETAVAEPAPVPAPANVGGTEPAGEQVKPDPPATTGDKSGK